MSRMCDKSVFVIFRPININYCHSRGCNLEYNLHSVFSQRPCSPDTYFALQYYSRLHYFALYFACFLSLKRIGSLVNEDDDFHNLIVSQFYPNFILKSPSISQLSNIAYMSGPRCDRCCAQVRVFPHHGPAVEEEQEPQPGNIRLLPRGGPQQKLRLQVGSRGQE